MLVDAVDKFEPLHCPGRYIATEGNLRYFPLVKTVVYGLGRGPVLQSFEERSPTFDRLLLYGPVGNSFDGEKV